VCRGPVMLRIKDGGIESCLRVRPTQGIILTREIHLWHVPPAGTLSLVSCLICAGGTAAVVFATGGAAVLAWTFVWIGKGTRIA